MSANQIAISLLLAFNGFVVICGVKRVAIHSNLIQSFSLFKE